ncbi:BolA family protein [Sulfuriflexus sp.]|uniref:BolA family protein n=1 Tax=Sulfuriflexus sp. TaxID=2015443 RepID=UPI0028CC5A23|nr:BolA family protein [Sulfuriflexus sp.]MDT8403500.1 BolA family protein [Sulfuriflexus sp.]
MQPEAIKTLIEEGLSGVEARVSGDGSHFEAIVIGEIFDGMSPLNKQRTVYGTLGDRITSGEIHALSIKAYTPAEWEKASKMQVS